MTNLQNGGKALVPLQAKSDLVVFKKPDIPKIKKKILDEDTYTKKVEKIIVRDFFPDLPKLNAQSEYLDAIQKNDLQKLRELHKKYGPKAGASATPNLYSTPATFETPDERPSSTPGGATDGGVGGEANPTHNPEPVPDDKVDPDVTLDGFMARNTSEDNASFAELMKVNEERHRQKHAWLYEQEEEHKERAEKALALPSVTEQAAKDGNQVGVDTWQYKPKNTLMYVPEGAEASAVERVEQARVGPRQIVHGNSRFHTSPFDQGLSRRTIARAAESQAQALQGKLGPDGKEILPARSPSVAGFGFVGTPSPAPGVDESPIMTWGEIDGTPFRLDGGDTPLPGDGGTRTPGPTFRMAAVPRRDQLLHDLADEIGRAHRDRKKEALERIKRLASPSPRSGLSRTERLAGLSPAAQRLASGRLGVTKTTDHALRATYTPSPGRRTPASDKTPLSITPSVTPSGRTPGARGMTPSGVTPGRRVGASKPSSSLTDNLLQLPKRAQAEDFF